MALRFLECFPFIMPQLSQTWTFSSASSSPNVFVPLTSTISSTPCHTHEDFADPSVCSLTCGHGDDDDESSSDSHHPDPLLCREHCEHTHASFASSRDCSISCGHSHSSFSSANRCRRTCGHDHSDFACPNQKIVDSFQPIASYAGANDPLVLAFAMDMMFHAEASSGKDKRRRLPSHFPDTFLGTWTWSGYELKRSVPTVVVFTFPQPFYTVHLTYF